MGSNLGEAAKEISLNGSLLAKQSTDMNQDMNGCTHYKIVILYLSNASSVAIFMREINPNG